MRVLHIGYRLPPMPGGKERYIEELVAEQLRRRHEVLVARRLGEVPPGAREFPLAPTPAARVVSRRSDVVAFAMECARALPRARGIDVVHAHGDHREALGLGAAARRLGVPLVLHVHGALTARHRRIMPLAFRHADGFITAGPAPRADLLAAGVPAERIRMVPSGLDLDRLAAFRGGSPVERGLIVSVGSLVPVKNHALTIEAFRELRELRELRATRPDARLVIVGEGPERARLERLAASVPGVELTGHLAADDVYSLVGRAHAFVLASHRLPTIGEGSPIAPLEALALGTAVVVSSEALPDPLIDPGAYLVFRSGSAGELADRLRSVLDDETVRPRLAERGVRAVAAVGWPLVAEGIEEWYGMLGADRSPHSAAVLP
ncbi:glycosyltransferase family 4 protein [Streptosporangium sp. NPDC048047]|uniref:glycosyltransferase family 4 protein n=1 Tax=Streptosporangium sp. NPDC048047 TaxID=3155748 RepID=UPI0034195786